MVRLRAAIVVAGLAVAGLLCSANTADAAKKKKGEKIEAQFNKLDTNGDGKLSPAEFAKLGTAAKGKAGKGKAKAAAKKANKVGTLFTKLDTNGDGSLSLEEFRGIRATKKKAK